MENEEAVFLKDIVRRVVDNPDSVQVTHEIDKQGVKLTLSVDQSDMGKVIGAQGRMATAIRTIMHAYGGQHEAKISVVIEEPERSGM